MNSNVPEINACGKSWTDLVNFLAINLTNLSG